MTTLTIRIEENLKTRAFNHAEKLGVPLTLVVKTALKNFIKSKQFIVGEPEKVEVSSKVQLKMDKIGKLLSKRSK
jgi:antitoxin component of RelBE/YafQ-DinJ toxin-antitoxin module